VLDRPSCHPGYLLAQNWISQAQLRSRMNIVYLLDVASALNGATLDGLFESVLNGTEKDEPVPTAGKVCTLAC
jgi:hypothetical protein